MQLLPALLSLASLGALPSEDVPVAISAEVASPCQATPGVVEVQIQIIPRRDLSVDYELRIGIDLLSDAILIEDVPLDPPSSTWERGQIVRLSYQRVLPEERAQNLEEDIVVLAGFRDPETGEVSGPRGLPTGSDGLADIADASGAAHKAGEKDRERLLAVLADPHLGSFGVVALVLQLLAKFVLLDCLTDARAFLPLVLVPFAARIGPLAWTWWLEPLHQGLGARFRSAIGLPHIMVWAVALAAASWFFPALLATPALVLWWGWHLRCTIGGISGDGHGAGIELTETALLLALLLASRWGLAA